MQRIYEVGGKGKQQESKPKKMPSNKPKQK